MNAGIPVVSYNADGPILNGVATPGTNRLCYVGQALYLSGQQMGEQIKSLAKPGNIVIFIATRARPTSSRATTAPPPSSPRPATRSRWWRPARRPHLRPDRHHEHLTGRRSATGPPLRAGRCLSVARNGYHRA